MYSKVMLSEEKRCERENFWDFYAKDVLACLLAAFIGVHNYMSVCEKCFTFLKSSIRITKTLRSLITLELCLWKMILKTKKSESFFLYPAKS